MNLVVPLSHFFNKVYWDWKERPVSNEERYEANIRSTFKIKHYQFSKVTIEKR